MPNEQWISTLHSILNNFERVLVNFEASLKGLPPGCDQAGLSEVRAQIVEQVSSVRLKLRELGSEPKPLN